MKFRFLMLSFLAMSVVFLHSCSKSNEMEEFASIEQFSLELELETTDTDEVYGKRAAPSRLYVYFGLFDGGYTFQEALDFISAHPYINVYHPTQGCIKTTEVTTISFNDGSGKGYILYKNPSINVESGYEATPVNVYADEACNCTPGLPTNERFAKDETIFNDSGDFKLFLPTMFSTNATEYCY